MDKFFKDFRQSVEKLSDSVSKRSSAAAASGKQSQGTRLGGTKPGKQLLFTFHHEGSLGCKVEKSEDTACCVVSYVQPNSQADMAGLKRGDIVYHAYYTEANEVQQQQQQTSITHDSFLKLVKSNQRPLIIEVRRIELTSTTAAAAAATAQQQIQQVLPSTSTASTTTSANAEVRRKAVIAAAEARERAHQVKNKPMDKFNKSGKRPITSTASISQPPTVAASEQTQRAIAAAKAGEAATAAQLGYNPYQVARGTGEQGQMAVIATTHGSINGSSTNPTISSNSSSHNNSSSQQQHQHVLQQQRQQTSINDSFDHAFVMFITSNDNSNQVISSLSTIRKLIDNAITKGMEEEEAESDKYRRVRLSNTKIKSAIVDLQGGLDLMLSFGFELVEQPLLMDDGTSSSETFLVYPLDQSVIPDWIPMALEQMNNYVEKSSSSSGV